jgi:hypothetical protein
MTNWRPIESAPKDGREITVRRTVLGRTTYEGPAIWRTVTTDAAAGWVNPASGEPVPAATHWKATGRGHPWNSQMNVNEQ